MNFFSAFVAPESGAGANAPVDGDEQNPPVWPKSVTIIEKDMSDEDAQNILRKLEDSRDPDTNAFVPTEHFSNERKAIFFEPRDEPYRLDVQVGYYVQVAGLGASAGDVTFAGVGLGPYCPAYYHHIDDDTGTCHHNGTCLDTFWRSAENFTNDTSKGILWAVSQAAPIRRVHAKNDLHLCQGGAFASGGHIANAQVEGKLVFGPQQQFCARSVTMGSEGTIVPGAWSNVYVDCVAPNTDLSTRAGTKTAASITSNVPSVTVEKCFLAMEGKDSKRFVLHVPKPRLREDPNNPTSRGADLTGADDEIRPLERVYVAKACLQEEEAEAPDYDVARKINLAFRQGKDVVLSPGIFHLTQPILMKKNDQVLLGIGMATLVAPSSGQPCIRVAPRTDGIRIGGIMFEASKLKRGLFSPAKSSFIEFGSECALDPGNPKNPGVLTDIFCRVGGSNLDREVSTDVMVRIHSGNVLGDNLWLWRADHVELGKHESPNFPDMDLEYHQTNLGEVPVKTGLEVTGNDVIIHGLAVEHTIEDQVVWRGDRGDVQFYQCELPYDVDQDFGTRNYVGFRATGKAHKLGGAGVYSNFRDHNVIVKTAIVHPDAFNEQRVVNPFIVHLNNQGRIMTVVSDGTALGGGPVFDNGEPGAMVAQFPALPTTKEGEHESRDA
ncbi:hypothetical protein ACHAXT_009338 [Thalassiosira profunda]